MANQLTPVKLLKIQLYDWKMLLTQLEANPATPQGQVSYCKAKVAQIEQDIRDLSLEE